MKPFVKVLIIFFVISCLFAGIFLVAGDQFEFVFSQRRCVEWFSMRPATGWIMGLLLLISDIFLPVPASGVMAASGAVYGIWTGTLIGFTGSLLSGVIGYATARLLGKKGSRFIASQEEMERFRYFFDKWGGYAIILSRILPMIPEVVTILAGFSGMKFSRFVASLTAGALPVSLLFASIGNASKTCPSAGIIIAILVPAILWSFFLKVVKI